jgi:hypothetical protein
VGEERAAGLARRVKALARTLPVHDLEAGKGARDGDWSVYDLRALALAAVDGVIDSMGLDWGATAADVRGRVAALARAAAPDRPAGQADQVAAAVLDGLLNDRNRREAFAVTYGDWSGPSYRRAELVFKLLEEVEAPDGTVVLRATDEAVNLFAGSLDRDVEDAHAAAEAVLESQLRRGRIDQALATAREARLRSIQFAAKVRRALDGTRRDLRQVDWGEDVPRLLDDALAHLADRLAVERKLRATLQETLGDLAETGDGGEAAVSAAQLLRVVAECQARHLELHEQVLGARSVFLAEQERQRFAPAGDVRLVDLGEELLKPLLRAGAAEGGPAAAAFLSAAVGAVPPRLARVVDLVESLLSPRRVHDEDRGAARDPDLVAIDVGTDRFPAEVRAAADAVLGQVGAGPVRLSALLARARAAGDSVPELVALTALHAYAPEGPSPLRATDDGTPLVDPQFAGADLLLQGSGS